MAKKSENYLDYVPKHNSRYEWSKNEKGNVVLRVHNTGFFNRIAQLLFRKPKYSNIELDEFGSFVWEKIDGVRNVHEIGVLVRGHFGEKAEPLYERLAKYFQILDSYGFVEWK